MLGARPLRRTVQREIEDTLAEKMLYGEVRPGQIILVDVEGEGTEAVFTFKGEQKSELPDLPPMEEPATDGESDERPRSRPEGVTVPSVNVHTLRRVRGARRRGGSVGAVQVEHQRRRR